MTNTADRLQTVERDLIKKQQDVLWTVLVQLVLPSLCAWRVCVYKYIYM